MARSVWVLKRTDATSVGLSDKVWSRAGHIRLTLPHSAGVYQMWPRRGRGHKIDKIQFLSSRSSLRIERRGENVSGSGADTQKEVRVNEGGRRKRRNLKRSKEAGY